MNRRDFLRTLPILGAGVVVAPMVLAEMLSEERPLDVSDKLWWLQPDETPLTKILRNMPPSHSSFEPSWDEDCFAYNPRTGEWWEVE